MILSCPFCGSIPTLVYRQHFKEYFVACSNKSCQAMVGRIWRVLSKSEWIKLNVEQILQELKDEGIAVSGLVCKTKQEAIDRWNRSKDRIEVKLKEVII